MTVEEGHVLNIDGSINNGSASVSVNNGVSVNPSNKYKSGDRAVSGVGRGSSTFQTTSIHASDTEDSANNPLTSGRRDANGEDRVSIMSGDSGRSKNTSQLEAAAKLPWYRSVTCKDVRDIMPTVLILIGGLLIMIFVIPYAFSSVIKQLEMEDQLQAISEATQKKLKEESRRQAAEAAAAAAAEAAAALETTPAAVSSSALPSSETAPSAAAKALIGKSASLSSSSNSLLISSLSSAQTSQLNGDSSSLSDNNAQLL